MLIMAALAIQSALLHIYKYRSMVYFMGLLSYSKRNIEEQNIAREIKFVHPLPYIHSRLVLAITVANLTALGSVILLLSQCIGVSNSSFSLEEDEDQRYVIQHYVANPKINWRMLKPRLRILKICQWYVVAIFPSANSTNIPKPEAKHYTAYEIYCRSDTWMLSFLEVVIPGQHRLVADEMACWLLELSFCISYAVQCLPSS